MPFHRWWAYEAVERQLEEARYAALRSGWRTRAAIRSGNERVQFLEEEVERLQLVVRTLTDLLKEKRIYDEEQFGRTLKRIDLEDGVEDGRITPKVPPAVAPSPPRRRRNRS